MYVEKLCQNDAAWLREIFAGGRSRGESERENGRGERASQTIQVISSRIVSHINMYCIHALLRGGMCWPIGFFILQDRKIC